LSRSLIALLGIHIDFNKSYHLAAISIINVCF